MGNRPRDEVSPCSLWGLPSIVDHEPDTYQWSYLRRHTNLEYKISKQTDVAGDVHCRSLFVVTVEETSAGVIGEPNQDSEPVEKVIDGWVLPALPQFNPKHNLAYMTSSEPPSRLLPAPGRHHRAKKDDMDSVVRTWPGFTAEIMCPRQQRAREKMEREGVASMTRYHHPAGMKSAEDCVICRVAWWGCYYQRRFLLHDTKTGELYRRQKTLVIFTDGSCKGNGQKNPQAGSAFVINSREDGRVSCKVELQGPDGVERAHGSYRAELRALLMALRYRHWFGEFWDRVIIASDSRDMVDNCTRHLWRWRKNGWKTVRGREVANKDLWEEIWKLVDLYMSWGCELSAWWIPRKWNTAADAAAKEATREKSSERFGVVIGF